MMLFRDNRLRDFSVPMGTTWLLNQLAEAKGKQELFTRRSPQLLNALREMALVQSVESSNRIEGVIVAADRLRPLVLGQVRPKDRSEQEITGYREALNLIHSEAEHLQITPDLLRQAIENLTGNFTVADLERLCPGVSRDHLRRLLKEMKAAGPVSCIGRGPGAKWQKRKEGHIPKRGS
jgi:hypothetical protein